MLKKFKPTMFLECLICGDFIYSSYNNEHVACNCQNITIQEDIGGPLVSTKDCLVNFRFYWGDNQQVKDYFELLKLSGE